MNVCCQKCGKTWRSIGRLAIFFFEVVFEVLFKLVGFIHFRTDLTRRWAMSVVRRSSRLQRKSTVTVEGQEDTASSADDKDEFYFEEGPLVILSFLITLLRSRIFEFTTRNTIT